MHSFEWLSVSVLRPRCTPEAAMVSWTKTSITEMALAQRWHSEHVTPAEIARRMGRNKSTIARHVVKKLPRRAHGAAAGTH